MSEKSIPCSPTRLDSLIHNKILWTLTGLPNSTTTYWDTEAGLYQMVSIRGTEGVNGKHKRDRRSLGCLFSPKKCIEVF